MSSTPQLLIVSAGLAAANQATPTGPFISIVAFSIGDGFNYTPQVTDVGLNGALLYSGVPTSYKYAGDGTMDIICTIPADAGPFNFGEVALYMPGGVMFAKAVFDTQQIKYSSLGTNVASTYTFNCLLKLSQGPAIISVTTDSGIPPAIWEVSHWSDVYPPNLSANPTIPSILIQELSPSLNDATLLIQASPTQWTISNNYRYFQSMNVGSNLGLTFVEADVAVLPLNIINYASGELVIRFADGYFRAVDKVTVVNTGLQYRFTFKPSALTHAQVVGSKFDIFLSTSSNSLYVQNGTGINQTSAQVKIGFGNNNLLLDVDGTSYQNNWPVNSSGTFSLQESGTYKFLKFSYKPSTAQPTNLWMSNSATDLQTVWPASTLNVGSANSLITDNGHSVKTNWDGTNLNFNLDNTGNSIIWPISAAIGRTVYNAGDATKNLTFNYNSFPTQPTSVWMGNNATDFQTVWPVANLSVGYATTSGFCNTSLGTNQSWQNLTSTRSNNVTYYNSTGRSITVNISGGTSGQMVANLSVNGVVFMSYNPTNASYNNAVTFSIIIPNGASYLYSTNGSINIWSELR